MASLSSSFVDITHYWIAGKQAYLTCASTYFHIALHRRFLGNVKTNSKAVFSGMPDSVKLPRFLARIRC